MPAAVAIPKPAPSRRPSKAPFLRVEKALTTPERAQASRDWSDANLTLWHAIQRGGDAGKRAKDAMVERNLPLVYALAGRYASEEHGFSYEDAVQEGALGLLRAIAKYDPAKLNPENGQPYTFATYAGRWITSFIARARTMQEHWIVTTPIWAIERAVKQRHRGEPSAIRIGKDVVDLSPGRYRVRSLDLPPDGLGDHEFDDSLGATIADETTPTPETRIALAEGRRFLGELVASAGLTPRERQVIGLRFGVLGCGEPVRMPGRYDPAKHAAGDTETTYAVQNGRVRTLLEIALHLKVSRERIRQIEEAALLKLRSFALHSARFRRDVRDVFATLDQVAS